MNNLSNLKERILIRDRKFDENKVYFIGQVWLKEELQHEWVRSSKKIKSFLEKREKLFYIGKRTYWKIEIYSKMINILDMNCLN